MKKIFYIISCLMLLVMVFSLVGCSSPSSEAPTQTEKTTETSKPIEICFAGFMPPSSPWETKVMEPLLKEIDEQTGGRVVITTYPGGTLLEGGKIYDGVATGAADMGHESLSWVNGRFHVADLLKKSGIPFESGEAASRTFKEMVQIIDPEEFHDTKVLMYICTGPGHLHTLKPVNTLEDLKGMEIRCIGSDAPSLTALGAKPVSMSHQDGYEALQKGIVQGTLASNETLQTWHNAEVTDYTTLTPFLYNGLQAVVMNLDTWNSLPADIQEGIQKACDKVWEEIGVHFFDIESDIGLQYAINETSQEIINLTEAETNRWKEKISHIVEEYVEELNAQGLPGSEAEKVAFELADKYNELHSKSK